MSHHVKNFDISCFRDILQVQLAVFYEKTEILCIGELQAAIESGDGAEAFRASHTLKGICLNLGFTALFDASSDLTEKLRGNNTLDDESKSLFARVHEEYDRTIQAIEKLDPQ